MSAHEEFTKAAHDHTLGATAAKVAPPVMVSGATIAGVPMADIVLWLTAFYLVIQIVYLAWKWQKEYRADGKRKRK